MSNAQDTNTMSVAILPSTPAPYVHVPLCPSMTSPAKRPKLSLDTTTSTSTFIGKHSTSLRLETLSATSPTVRNTFGNRNAGHKLALNTNDVNTNKRRYAVTPKELDDSPLSATASPVLPVKTSGECPYSVSFHISSILRNGPLQQSRSRKSLSQLKASAKKVLFRAPLTEEVKNKKYTLAHSDIEPPTPTLEKQEVPVQEKVEEVDNQQLLQPVTYSSEKKVSQESESESCPATPVAGRRKKDRQ